MHAHTHTLGGFMGQDSWLFLRSTQHVAAGFWRASRRWLRLKHVTQRLVRTGSLFSQQLRGATHFTAKTWITHTGFQSKSKMVTHLTQPTILRLFSGSRVCSCKIEIVQEINLAESLDTGQVFYSKNDKTTTINESWCSSERPDSSGGQGTNC